MTANILVVEDEHPIQELLAFNIAHCGYCAIKAYDTIEAWAHSKQALPD